MLPAFYSSQSWPNCDGSFFVFLRGTRPSCCEFWRASVAVDRFVIASLASLWSHVRSGRPMRLQDSVANVRISDRSGRIDSPAHEKCDRADRAVAFGFALALARDRHRLPQRLAL